MGSIRDGVPGTADWSVAGLSDMSSPCDALPDTAGRSDAGFSLVGHALAGAADEPARPASFAGVKSEK